MAYRIRRGQGNDAPAVAELIYSSGPDVFEYMFGHGSLPAIDVIKRTFKKGRGFLGARAHFVVEDMATRQVVAVISSYDKLQYIKLAIFTVRDLFQVYPGYEAVSVLRRCFKIQSRVKSPGFFSLYFANIGVHQDFQSLGIGSMMFDEIRHLARYKFIRAYIGDVSVENHGARRLYEKVLGFRPEFVADFPGTTVKSVFRMNRPARLQPEPSE